MAVKINKFTAPPESSALKRILILSLIACIPFLNYYAYTLFSSNDIYKNLDDLPPYRYALVFGAGQNYPSDNPNYSFTGRVDAAEKFARSRPETIIILSGSVTGNENEARALFSELESRGIGRERMVIDSSGTNTLQSLLNFKNNFDKPVVLISSESHLERAICYAKDLNLSCCGYSALFSHRFFLREVFARLKATIQIAFII